MSAAPDDANLSRDGFLGGRLTILQPRHGYRAATDPVLLAAAVPALPGQSVLELGCGAGVALLCLGIRVAGLRLVGLELQASYAALARRNAAANGLSAEILEGDVASLPPGLRAAAFDHVLANPPWHPRGGGTPAGDAGRETALREAEVPVAAWVDVAIRRLAPGGWLTMIQQTERLPDLLRALDRRMGSFAVRPLAARPVRAAGRFILRARKGGRGGFRLLAPLVLHAGPEHRRDGEGFAPEAEAILRQAAALDF